MSVKRECFRDKGFLASFRAVKLSSSCIQSQTVISSDGSSSGLQSIPVSFEVTSQGKEVVKTGILEMFRETEERNEEKYSQEFPAPGLVFFREESCFLQRNLLLHQMPFLLVFFGDTRNAREDWMDDDVEHQSLFHVIYFPSQTQKKASDETQEQDCCCNSKDLALELRAKSELSRRKKKKSDKSIAVYTACYAATNERISPKTRLQDCDIFLVWTSNLTWEQLFVTKTLLV